MEERGCGGDGWCTTDIWIWSWCCGVGCGCGCIGGFLGLGLTVIGLGRGAEEVVGGVCGHCLGFWSLMIGQGEGYLCVYSVARCQMGRGMFCLKERFFVTCRFQTDILTEENGGKYCFQRDDFVSSDERKQRTVFETEQNRPPLYTK